MSKTNGNCQDFIAKLAKVVADYYDGIALIDREIDDACERIDQSVANIRGESAKRDGHSNSELSQERKLREQSEKIERDISKTEDEIARLDKGIVAVDAAIRAMKQEKTSLEQQIQNRWLIEKIYYFFCQDEDKEQCDRLQSGLDNRAKEKSALEKTKREFESARLQAVSKKKSLQTTLGEIRHKLAALEKSAEYTDEQARILASKRMEAESRRIARKCNLLTFVSSAWERASGESTQGMGRIRRHQPAFVDLREDNPRTALVMPDALLLGSQQVSFKELHCLVPHVIPFPFEHALVLPEDNAAQRRLAHHLLLRLLQTVPPGRLELTLVDPLKLG